MDEDVKKTDAVLEGIFYFACIWALGVTTNEEGRVKFNEYFKRLYNSFIYVTHKHKIYQMKI